MKFEHRRFSLRVTVGKLTIVLYRPFRDPYVTCYARIIFKVWPLMALWHMGSGWGDFPRLPDTFLGPEV